MDIAEIICWEASRLPENLAREVLDFIEYLQSKHDLREPATDHLKAAQRKVMDRLWDTPTMRPGMSCNPGELVAIPFPYADLKTRKRRPVLVITHPDRHDDFIGLAVTSVSTDALSVPINENSIAFGRLPKPSWVRCDKVFTLSQGDVIGNYGALKSDVFSEV